MNNLIKKELTLDSREVAEMVGKRHDHLIRDIETYIQYLENPDLGNGLKPIITDFFIESSYKSGTPPRNYKKYDCTKKGCEFIAHKLTGQKGALFTATYINRFHEIEQALAEKQPKAIPEGDVKAKEVDARLKNANARLKNANARQAKLLMQIAESVEIKEYKQILNAKATEIITGENLLPLPEAEEKTYTATEIGEMLGISANKVGRLANEHNLKTSEFGKMFYDKAKHSNKQVETFRYYENVIPILEKLNGGM